jgi:hypothetical protein
MKINVDVLSKYSIGNAMTAINSYEAKLKRLKEELPKALAEYGMNEATVRFSYSVYDILLSGSWSTPDIRVSAEQTENGWAVVANGKEVCFIEFGAGVYYNGSSSYLGNRPTKVVGIGEYGKGKGKRDMWVFYDNSGDKTFTHGTPANNALYFTAQEMRSKIAETARSILNGND